MKTYEVIAYETVERRLRVHVLAENEEEALDKVTRWDDDVYEVDAEVIFDNAAWITFDNWTVKEVNNDN